MNYIRGQVERMSGYVPGEQPKVAGLIKLNTNENPYHHRPRSWRRCEERLMGSCGCIPDPTSSALRVNLARFTGLAPSRLSSVTLRRYSQSLCASLLWRMREAGVLLAQLFVVSRAREHSGRNAGRVAAQ